MQRRAARGLPTQEVNSEECVTHTFKTMHRAGTEPPIHHTHKADQLTQEVKSEECVTHAFRTVHRADTESPIHHTNKTEQTTQQGEEKAQIH